MSDQMKTTDYNGLMYIQLVSYFPVIGQVWTSDKVTGHNQHVSSFPVFEWIRAVDKNTSSE